MLPQAGLLARPFEENPPRRVTAITWAADVPSRRCQRHSEQVKTINIVLQTRNQVWKEIRALTAIEGSCTVRWNRMCPCLCVGESGFACPREMTSSPSKTNSDPIKTATHINRSPLRNGFCFAKITRLGRLLHAFGLPAPLRTSMKSTGQFLRHTRHKGFQAPTTT